MPLYNPEIIGKLISEMRKSVKRLNVLSSIDENQFKEDPDKIASAKYHFIVAIESIIGIANHIISQNGFRKPDDYADTFKVLLEEGIIDADFANNLQDMSKFRNRFVHIYWQVDDDQLWNILKSRLSDFKKFLNSISDFLKLEKL
ncbi:MAG: DUF86 domain-containing protein [Candidatus Schekmanbacteria bacterium]|nr:MAG: DUF86 domain-containing protein [Candidatus Schekmanbacteria bacterium]